MNKKALKDIGIVITGKTPSKKEPKYFDGDIPFITPAELGKSQFVYSSPQTLTELGAAQIKMLPENTVMMCCIGSLGKCAIAGKAMATNQQINSIIFDENKVYYKYGFYAVQQLKPLMEHLAPATTVQILNKSSFEKLEIPVPSLDEQHHIAQTLDQATSLIEKRKAQIAELDKLVKAVFLEMFGDPIANNKKFPTAQLKDIGLWRSGGTPARNKKEYWNGNIDWITSGELEDLYISDTYEKISELGLQESSAKLIETGSLLLGMYDTAGLKSSITTKPMTCNQAIAFAQINEQKVNVLFVYYFIQFSKQHLLKQQRGVRQQNFNLSMIKDIGIFIPSLDLQTLFAQKVCKIEAEKDRLQRSLAEMENNLTALMGRFFE